MSEWSATEVSPAQPPGAVVRYLFSGPDILHAIHMFPTAGTFILCGLEPVGQAPDITALNEGNVATALGEVRNSLGEIIQLSFFRTKDMKDDLQFATFQGTTPIMMIFLAKSGQYVKELEFLKLHLHIGILLTVNQSTQPGAQCSAARFPQLPLARKISTPRTVQISM